MNIKPILKEIEAGKNIFLDSETCGFAGMPVLLQLAVDEGDIHLYEAFKEPFSKTLELLEAIVTRNLVGFNLTFDTFHICKLYTMLLEFVKSHPELSEALPEDHIDKLIALEERATAGPCWKPRAACDLMLHARKNQYQSLMARRDITIRRVPTALSYALAQELEQRVDIPDIYFARFKNRDKMWVVQDIEDEEYFKNVVLKFNAAAGLKYLAEHALGYKPPFHFEDVAVAPEYLPDELGYCPTAAGQLRFAAKYGTPSEPKNKTWDKVIHHHIEHWHSNKNARQYAHFDIVITRDLWVHFEKPEPGDDDSEIACSVAATRWRGMSVDLEQIKKLKVAAEAIVAKSPINTNKPTEVRAYLSEVMCPIEQILIQESTGKKVLLMLVEMADENQEMADRAQQLLDIKIAIKEVQLYDKVLIAGRVHPDFNVIGTKSSRLSGRGGINFQGIKREKHVRRAFTLADEGYTLCGGDYTSFENFIADSQYLDPDFREVLTSGQKLHGIFGTLLYPGQTYEQILASDGTKNDMYTKAKGAVYSLMYGGDERTISRNQSVPIEQAYEAVQGWYKMFPKIDESTKDTEDRFMALKQPAGIGTAIVWTEPDDFVETENGFKRFFTLENMVSKALFELAQAPPKKWKEVKMKVARRERLQTASGAVQSALYGAAFGILSGNVRAAVNHKIQATAAILTKQLQRCVIEMQPTGVHEFIVSMIQIHDEIMCPTKHGHEEQLADVIEKEITRQREMVPLLAMDWNLKQDSWAEKSGGSISKLFAPTEDEILPIGV